MKDNFRGVWGSIDGCFVYMEIIYEEEEYNLYTIPILLNGEKYNLRVTYDYISQKYSIMGAIKGIDDNGMSNGNLRQIKNGDEIITLHYAMTISGDDDPILVPVDTIIFSDTTSFYDENMGDGMFIMMFEMIDASGNSALSQTIEIEVLDGDIFLSQI